MPSFYAKCAKGFIIFARQSLIVSPPREPLTMFSCMQMILQETPRLKHFGIQRKLLPLEPSFLLREANRRRASLSAGNMFEMFEGRPAFNDGYWKCIH